MHPRMSEDEQALVKLIEPLCTCTLPSNWSVNTPLREPDEVPWEFSYGKMVIYMHRMCSNCGKSLLFLRARPTA